MAAAQATGLFAIILDQLFEENDSYPACVVWERRAPSKPIAEGGTLYQKDWRYSVHVLVEKSSGYVQLEACTDALIKELLKTRGFRVVDEDHSEVMIAEDDILAATLVVEKPARKDYR